MDIKAKAEEIVKKVQSDPALLKEFQTDPSKTVQKLIGVEIPAEALTQVTSLVQGKIAVNNAAGAVNMLKKLF